MSNTKIFLIVILFYIFVVGLFALTDITKQHSLKIKENKEIFYYNDSTEIFYLDGGSFPVSASVIISKDTVEVIRYINHVQNDNTTDTRFDAKGITFIKDGHVPVIWLPNRPNTPHELSIMVHEISHVVCFTFQYCGVPMDESTDEVYAYQMSLLTEQFLNKK